MLAKKIHCQAQLLISNNLIIHHPGYVLFIYQCTLFAVIYKFKLLELTLLMFSSLRHRWPKLILAILFMPFGFIAPKDFTIVCLSNILVSSIFDEGYSRNESCTLNLISTFWLPCNCFILQIFHWLENYYFKSCFNCFYGLSELLS